MESTSSFIPQNNLRKKPKKQGRRRIYIISYVVYVMFFGTLLTVVGLYAWSLQLEAQLAAEQNNLSLERASFSEGDILRVKELNERLDLMRFVMDSHPALSKLFTALEDTTLENIQVTNFSVSSGGSGNNFVSVSFSGSADTFDAVLFQRDVMQQNSILSQAKIVDVTYNEAAQDDEQFASANYPIRYSVSLAIPLTSIAFDGSESSFTASSQNDAESASKPEDDGIPAVDLEIENSTSPQDTAAAGSNNDIN